ncbi:MAG: thiamine pyrophosphate-dependent enzyme [Alphaproteobacteria bacterium]|nr:thiamine pyrophosphate-dependent enzyme [Alphaproteobacteria bacterium]
MARPAPVLDRRLVLPALFPSPDEILFVSGLAGPARDAAELCDDGDNLFTMAGTMGAAVPMGLGIALGAPDRRVVVITGDGELLMKIGSLATVATMAPGNLAIVCLDNGCHGETGGQTGHTAHRTDLAKMAEGAGLPSVMVLEAEDQMAAAKAFLEEAPGPRFLHVRVTDGPPHPYKRNFDLAYCRTKFRDAYLGSR